MQYRPRTSDARTMGITEVAAVSLGSPQPDLANFLDQNFRTMHIARGRCACGANLQCFPIPQTPLLRHLCQSFVKNTSLHEKKSFNRPSESSQSVESEFVSRHTAYETLQVHFEGISTKSNFIMTQHQLIRSFLKARTS